MIGNFYINVMLISYVDDGIDNSSGLDARKSESWPTRRSFDGWVVAGLGPVAC